MSGYKNPKTYKIYIKCSLKLLLAINTKERPCSKGLSHISSGNSDNNASHKMIFRKKAIKNSLHGTPYGGG